MGLLQEVTELAANARKGPLCGMALIHLDDSDRAELEDVMADGRISSKVISEVLKKRGCDIQPQTVSRHRKRECRCG